MEEERKTIDSIFYNNLFNPSNKVHCNSCEKDISKQTKIFCAD